MYQWLAVLLIDSLAAKTADNLKQNSRYGGLKAISGLCRRLLAINSAHTVATQQPPNSSPREETAPGVQQPARANSTHQTLYFDHC